MPLKFLKKGIDGVLKVVGEVTGIDSIGEAIEAIKGNQLSPEQEAELRKRLIEQENALIEAASEEVESRAGIIRAEASSEDNYVRRARPTFLYLMYIVLGINFAVIPLLRVFGVEADPVTLPGNLYALFGVGYTGYAYLRSKDKQGGLESPQDLFRM